MPDETLENMEILCLERFALNLKKILCSSFSFTFPNFSFLKERGVQASVKWLDTCILIKTKSSKSSYNT